MGASASVSSGPTCTKCDVEQHAQQSPQGTSASASCRSAACIASSQAPKAPAASSSGLLSLAVVHEGDVAAGGPARQAGGAAPLALTPRRARA